MTLAQFIAWAAGMLLNILGIGNQVKSLTEHAAQEHVPFVIEGIVTTAGLNIANPTYGLAALRTELDAIAAAVAAITPTPAVPPPSADDNATAVWQFMISQQQADGVAYNAMAQEWLYATPHSLAIYSATEGVPDGEQPFYRIVFGGLSTGYSIGYHPNIISSARPDPPDFTQLIRQDTVVSFLQRTQPAYGWTGTGPAGVWSDNIAWKNIYGGATGVWWRTAFTLPVKVGQDGPPVWPGDAQAQLGTPVALAPGVTITEPMDGVLIQVTSVAAKQMYYTYDDLRAYRHIGALAFVSDDGQAEAWQSLGFISAVYCPRFMTRAAAVKIMTAVDTVGTATPWTRL